MPLKLRRYAALEKRITKKIILFGGDFAGEDIFKLSNEKICRGYYRPPSESWGRCRDCRVCSGYVYKKSLIVSWQINAKTKVFYTNKILEEIKELLSSKETGFYEYYKEKKRQCRDVF